MELPTRERIIEILKNNFFISELFDYFNENEISFYFNDDNNVDINIKRDTWETVLLIEIDNDFYDEKFVDVDKYEVDDMGLKFSIWTGGGTEDLSMVNIWRHLFFEKEPASKR